MPPLLSCECSRKKDKPVIIPAAPVVDFEADQTTGVAPLTVQFTDRSTGSITGWEWDFDDNGSVEPTLLPAALFVILQA